MKQGNLLIVDDNKSVLSALRLFLKHHFAQVITCSNPNQIPALLFDNNFDVVLLDMNFSAGVNSGNEGLYWLQEILKIDAHPEVILFTAYGDVNLAVSAMKYGASDFILKPWDNDKLLATLKNGVDFHQSRLQEQPQLEKTGSTVSAGVSSIIGESEAMKKVFSTIEKVAKTEANVLILGENGTGKELVAQEIHRLSLRKQNIFLTVDLGALHEGIFESELFGHTKGAFTDAKEERQGRFQTANGGTIFLDEIGNLSMPMQAKLLSALQNRQVTPLGSNRVDKIDVRLICATNANINQMIMNGAFREDLLYRINTIQLELPPLRERGDDVLLLANYFLEKYAKRYSKVVPTLDESAQEMLLQYNWPGNIRELQHAMERTIILTDNTMLTASDFELKNNNIDTEIGNQAISLEEGEKLIIANAIKRNKGNISQVAKELNVGRQTLYRKIEKYNIY